jgi:LmbE family N-acetylglucosaminyl deacetylase
VNELEQVEQEHKVAMVVVAHADDAEFGCAGTVACWVRDGWDVYYVICTDGGSGGPDEATEITREARQHVVETRMREQRAAAEILGVKDVLFLGYPDGELQPTLALRRDIVRLLRKYRPARVICQSPERNWEGELSIPASHPDHLAAGQAALAAIYPAAQNPWDFAELINEEGLKPHKVSEVYIMSAPRTNYGMDIAPVIEQKWQALLAHKSQLGEPSAEFQQFLRHWSSEVGKKYSYEHGEEFHLTKNY